MEDNNDDSDNNENEPTTFEELRTRHTPTRTQGTNTEEVFKVNAAVQYEAPPTFVIDLSSSLESLAHSSSSNLGISDDDELEASMLAFDDNHLPKPFENTLATAIVID